MVPYMTMRCARPSRPICADLRFVACGFLCIEFSQRGRNRLFGPSCTHAPAGNVHGSSGMCSLHVATCGVLPPRCPSQFRAGVLPPHTHGPDCASLDYLSGQPSNQQPVERRHILTRWNSSLGFPSCCKSLRQPFSSVAQTASVEGSSSSCFDEKVFTTTALNHPSSQITSPTPYDQASAISKNED